jgi:flagellar protein FlgJ
MTVKATATSQALDPVADRKHRLRESSRQLEAVFLNQLLAVMRQTIPESGLFQNSTSDWLFNSMLDEQLSRLAAQRSSRGLGEALYRQLSRRLDEQTGTGRP